MATPLITITNISPQAVPILIDTIPLALANSNSNLAATTAGQVTISPGTKVTVETRRTNEAQLEQLQNKKLITFTDFND